MGASLVLLMLCSGAPAEAQLPPIPPIPEGLVPVVEVLGPVVGAKCSDAQAILVVGGAVAAGPIEDALGINILGEDLASVFVACGLLSGTSTAQYRCLADDVVKQAIEAPLVSIAGLPLPIQVDYLAQLLRTTYEIQDLLPNATLDAGLLDLVTETVSCVPLDGSGDGSLPPPVSLPPAPPSADPPATPPSSAPTFDAPAVTSTPPSFGLGPVAVVEPTPRSADVPPSAELATSFPLVPIGRFRYPGAFLLPVVFLAAAAYLSRAMTRSLDPTG